VSGNPARVLVIGLVVMFILKVIAAVIGAILNPHPIINFAGGWLGFASGIIGVRIGLFFPFIFIWIIVWFERSISWMSRSYRYSSRNGCTWWDDDALEILRERHARGEITKGQYDNMREDFEKLKLSNSVLNCDVAN